MKQDETQLSNTRSFSQKKNQSTVLREITPKVCFVMSSITDENFLEDVAVEWLAVGLNTRVTGWKMTAHAAQTTGFITSPCLKLSAGSRVTWGEVPVVQQPHVLHRQLSGLRLYHSDLQQGEWAQERAFWNSWGVDDHCKQCRFALPVMASGWCASPSTPCSPALFKCCLQALKSHRYRHKVRYAAV